MNYIIAIVIMLIVFGYLKLLDKIALSIDLDDVDCSGE